MAVQHNTHIGTSGRCLAWKRCCGWVSTKRQLLHHSQLHLHCVSSIHWYAVLTVLSLQGFPEQVASSYDSGYPFACAGLNLLLRCLPSLTLSPAVVPGVQSRGRFISFRGVGCA